MPNCIREDPWKGRGGLLALILELITCIGFNWLAWVGGPTSDGLGRLALKRGAGQGEKLVPLWLWRVSLLVLICTVAGGMAFAATGVWCVITRSRPDRGRSYQKAILVIFIVSFVSVVTGALASGLP
jgi:hypothetical protein